MSEKDALNVLLKAHSEVLSDEVRSRILSFYELVLRENQVQNLTRLTSPDDFYNGHVIDILELLKSEIMDFPALDLGSGVGVPGLLAALVEERASWILSESEARKREYLERATKTLGLDGRVSVAPGRAEDFLKSNPVKRVVARAVGPISRIYLWLRPCSTWNTLVLFKGPGWNEEWAEFQKTKFKNEVILEKEHIYSVGPEKKERRIVKLRRVKK